ncbi:MlaD family protein [Pseudonocardia sp. Cha107L01]|uniref:MlaD family protein n=1 Tax=Pseudonocardia sp. Cha107L01 TaxID=3457576 RepID=UPI00403E6566
MNRLKKVSRGVRRRARGASPLKVGLIALIGVLLFGVVVFEKDFLITNLSFGNTIKAEFPHGYKLQSYQSKVKIADVVVGTVTSSEPTDRDTAMVSMKLDSGTLDKLGEAPAAAITATTLLGGTYYVELIPGGTGRFNDTLIPLDRSKTPVELGDVLTAFTPDALKAVPGTIGQFDATLKQGGSAAIRDLLADAPSTLAPAGEVLAAFRGTRPDNDLTEVVSGLRNTAAGMLKNEGQLGYLFQDLRRSTGALAAGSRPFADSVRTSPETLRATRAGLSDLRGTLHRLTTTSDSLRPTARQLGSLLDKADPVLDRARPVVSDLRDVLEDARPMVDQLNPTADSATDVLDNIQGPVLDRVKGPIADMVLNSWQGTGVYKGGGSPNKFYEELGYLGVNGALAWQTHDGNGAQGRLAAGGGAQSVGGAAFPKTLEEYLEALGLGGPPGPQADRPGAKPGPLPSGISNSKPLPVVPTNPLPLEGNASNSLPLGLPR